MFSADYGLPVVMLGAYDGIHVAPFGNSKVQKGNPIMAPTTHMAPTLNPFNKSDLEVNRCTADNRDNFPQFGMICCVTSVGHNKHG